MARAIGRAFSEDGSQGRYVSPELIAEYADKPTQTYLYLTRRYGNGTQSIDDRARVAGVYEISRGERSTHDDALREGRGYDQSSDTGSGGQVSGEAPSTAAQLSSYDWYNNDVAFGQPPILVESSEPFGFESLVPHKQE